MAELREIGIYFIVGDVSIDQQVWNYCRAHTAFAREGKRVSFTRFQDAITAGVRCLPLWSIHAFERLVVSHKLDFLTGRKFKERFVAGAAEHVGEGGGSTNPAHITISDRSLRTCCQNAVVCSTMVLSDYTNRRIVRIVVAVAQWVRFWHKTQNVLLRCVEGAKAWLLSQVDGGYIEHVVSTIKELSNCVTLRACTFIVPDGAVGEAIDDDLPLEDEYSDLFAQSVMTMAKHRVRRHLHLMVGWPQHMQKVRRLGVKAADTIKLFLLDGILFAELCALEDILYNNIFI